MRQLRTLAGMVVVVAATFAKIFPFSGHLLAIALVVLITRVQNPEWFRTWFGRIPMRQAFMGSVICALAVVGTDLMLLEVLPKLGLAGVDFSRFHGLRAARGTTAAWIAGVWLVVAPSEEFISRAFLINQLGSLVGDSRPAAALAVVVSSLTFGLVHFYQGASGVIMSVCAGLWLGSLYLQQRRALWANILAHGLVDSAAMLAFFFGRL